MGCGNNDSKELTFLDICTGIVGSEADVPSHKKAILALYFMNVLGSSSEKIKHSLEFIGHGNILLELCVDKKYAEDIYNFFCHNDYENIGNYISQLLDSLEKKFIKLECSNEALH